eukprot:6668337-Prymnesium_polylepis.1
MEPRTLGCKHRNCQNQLKKSLLNAIAAALLTSVWPGVSGRCDTACASSARAPPPAGARKRIPQGSAPGARRLCPAPP